MNAYLTIHRLPVLMLFLAGAILLFGFASPAAARDISIQHADASEVQGTFTIIAYGCESTSESPSLAILKKEGTAYDFTVEPTTAFFWGSLQETDTQKMTGVRAPEALARATSFVKCNPDVMDVEINKIVGPQGTVLGYEVRPVYMPLRYGSEGLFSTAYTIEQNQVLASVIGNPLSTTDQWGGG